MIPSDEKTLQDTVREVVTAFVSNNAVAAEELPNLIRQVRIAFSEDIAPAAAPDRRPPVHAAPPALAIAVPAVPISESRTASAIVCLVCGKKFRSLKNHLRSAHNLDGSAYLARYGLPSDYSLVCEEFSEIRSNTAKRLFGRD